jgi:Domain of unknown function (DUF4145)
VPLDWKGFIASLVSSLAWPAVVAFTVFLLRRPLRQVILGLRRFKYRDLEAEFEGRVQEADAAARRAELPPSPVRTMALSTRLAPQISTEPRAAVVAAWLILEREVELLARAAGVDLAGRIWTTPALVKELAQRGVIDARLVEVLNDLRRARNAAAHEEPFTPDRDDVVEYVKLAGRVGDALQEIRERLESAGGSEERN